MRFASLALLAAAAFLAWPVASAQASFSDDERAEIESIVRDLLTDKDPEIIIKAAQIAEQKMNAKRVEEGQKNVSKNKDKLLSDSKSPVGGNPKGSVTVVEFYDYQCGYCKLMQPHLAKLLDENKNVRFVYKEFPVLGAASVTAAKASLASVKQGKFAEFHDALMTEKGHFAEDTVDKIAKKVGLDVEKLHKDMADSGIQKTIDANIALGRDIGANGTPTFVIGDKIIPGAISFEELKQTVESAKK
jgi:protein-disulfide isomerase